jgi:type IV secretory pathway TraG/TraD family ATPase VirD4
LDHAQAQARATGGLDPLIAAQSLWNKEQRLRGSVFATIENVLAGYADPGVGHTAERDDIDLAAWLDGNNTIYVVATAHEQARLRPVLTVLVQQAIRTAYERANALGGTLEQPCLVLLDEAGNIAPLRDLPGYASTARSHGITLVSIWQDLAQIKAIYRDRAQTVLNNHQAKLFGTGIADDATLEYVSRLIGDQRHTDVNLSGDLHGTRRSISEHVAYRRAAPVDLLRRIRPNEAILVYGSELPAHVRLRPWYSRPALSRLARGARLSKT